MSSSAVTKLRIRERGVVFVGCDDRRPPESVQKHEFDVVQARLVSSAALPRAGDCMS